MKDILKVDVRLYEARRERMRKLIELNAPQVVLRNEAELFLRSFKRRTFKERWIIFFIRRCPEWLLLLVSPTYRSWKNDA